MAKLGGVFDARTIRPADPDGLASFLPVGNQPCMVIGNDIKNNNDPNTGKHIEIKLQCVDGPAKGQVGSWRLNLYYNNPADPAKSETTRRIAAEQLSALCHVTEVYVLPGDGDLDILNGKYCIAVVESQNNVQKPEYTQIAGVLDVNGDKPGQKGVKGRERVAAPIPPAPAPQAAQQAWNPAGGAAPPAAATTFGPSSAPAPGFAAPAAQAPVASPVANWAPAVAPAAPAAQTPVASAPAPAAAGVPDWARK